MWCTTSNIYTRLIAEWDVETESDMVWLYPCKHVYTRSILCQYIYSCSVGKTKTAKGSYYQTSPKKRCKTREI